MSAIRGRRPCPLTHVNPPMACPSDVCMRRYSAEQHQKRQKRPRKPYHVRRRVWYRTRVGRRYRIRKKVNAAKTNPWWFRRRVRFNRLEAKGVLVFFMGGSQFCHSDIWPNGGPTSQAPVVLPAPEFFVSFLKKCLVFFNVCFSSPPPTSLTLKQPTCCVVRTRNITQRGSRKGDLYCVFLFFFLFFFFLLISFSAWS